MLRWYPDPLLRVVLAITWLLPVVGATLVLRCLCLPATEWRIGPFGGVGATGDLWVLLLATGLGLTIAALGWRGAGRAFSWLLLIWHATLAVVTTTAAVAEGPWRAECAGIDLVVSIELLGPVVTIATLLGALTWVVRDRRRGSPGRTVSPWSRRNTLVLALAGALVAAAAGAYRLQLDEAAVLISGMAGIVGYVAVRPTNPSETLLRAFAAEDSAIR